MEQVLALRKGGQSLRAIAREIEQAIRPLSGVRDLVANREVLADTVPVRFDSDKLAHYGLTPANAATQLRAQVEPSGGSNRGHYIGSILGVANASR